VRERPEAVEAIAIQSTMKTERIPTTRKPCPVCGGTWDRVKDKPCPTCLDWIARMRRLEESMRAELEPIGTPPSSNAWQYIPEVDREGRSEFCEALHTIWQLATTEGAQWRVGMKTLKAMEDPRGYWTPKVRLAKPGLAEAVDALHASVSTMVKSAYQAGHKSGRNLLAGLASGEMTVGEFNDRAERQR